MSNATRPTPRIRDAMRDADGNVDMVEADVVVLLCLMYCTPDGAQSLSLSLSLLHSSSFSSSLAEVQHSAFSF